MINVSFPDGSVREYPDGSTPMTIAEAISKSLAKRSVIARVNGELFDMKRPLPGDVKLELLDINAQESLELLRHDASHVMAQAVQELFPGTQVTIGPVIDKLVPRILKGTGNRPRLTYDVERTNASDPALTRYFSPQGKKTSDDSLGMSSLTHTLVLC